MPTDIEYRQQIDQSIRNFSRDELYQSAINLFETLGYHSQKRLSLQPNTAEQFCTEFDVDGELKDKTLLSEWEKVDFLFQMTDDEINDCLGQKSLFSSKKVDNTVINSYLFFAIQLKKEQYTRTQLADITREVNKLFSMPVMILFQHGQSLTLSIIARRLNMRDASKKDVLEKVTLIKEISIADPHRAHVEILFDLSISELNKESSFTNFVELQKAWEKTLDISELNKKFYKEVADWYFWAIQNVRFPVGDNKDSEENRNAINTIRLITRLIFVWFLKEKKLISEDLFRESKIRQLLKFDDPNNSTYYKAILQNLFFATLNQEMNTKQKPDNRKFRIQSKQPGGRDSNRLVTNLYRYERYFKDPQSALNLFSTIPFLNGGLFECLDKEIEKDGRYVVIRIDGFSDEVTNPLSIPDDLFFASERNVDLNSVYDTRNKRYPVRGIIHVLNRYKFTIEENTPITEEIALDPELLGKVFENLLASFNPETRTTARKQTGSYYTPREIVSYMVDESLISYFDNYLTSRISTQKTQSEALIMTQPKLMGENQPALTTQLDNNTRLRHLLSYNDESPQFTEEETVSLIEAIDLIKVLDPACGSGAFPMGILHKLVFLLSRLDPGNFRWKQKQLEKANEILDTTVREKVVEDVEKAFSENEFDYGRKLYLIENCIFGVDIQPIAVQITKLRFFISLVVDQRINVIHENFGIRPLPNLETKFVVANTLLNINKPQQLAFKNPEIDILENKILEIRKKHFSAKTTETKRKCRIDDTDIRKHIGQILEKDGFPLDVSKRIVEWNPYDPNLSANYFDSFWMFGNKQGFNIVIGNPPYLTLGGKEDSNLSVDVVNQLKSYSSYEYKTNLFVLFIEQGLSLLSKNGSLTFIVPRTILDNFHMVKIREKILAQSLIKLIIELRGEVFENAVLGGNAILILQSPSEVKKNIKVASIADTEFEKINFYEISQEKFKSSFQKRFFINSDDTDNLFNKIIETGISLGDICDIKNGVNTGNAANILLSSSHQFSTSRRILEGKDVSRYAIHWGGLWINYDSKIRNKIDISKLETRQKKIDFALRDERIFNTEKLVIRQTSDKLVAAFDKDQFITRHSTHLLLQKNQNFSLHFILGLLNSKLLNFYYSILVPEKGKVFAEVKIVNLEKLPIFKADGKAQSQIIEIVERIEKLRIENPNGEIGLLEDELNNSIYSLYDLSQKEISIINQSD